jgi:hypothetical protein
MTLLLATAAALALLPAAAFAQDHQHDPSPQQASEPSAEDSSDQDSMAGMDMSHMDMSAMHMSGQGSGTSRLPPNETMGHGAMIGLGGDAMVMLHGFVSLTENLFMIGMALWMVFSG